MGMHGGGSGDCKMRELRSHESRCLRRRQYRLYPYGYIGYGGLLADTVQRIWTNHIETCGGA